MAGRCFVLCLLSIQAVLANVEKTIFVAPAAQSLPQDASIDNLLLTRLSEQYPSARTVINASFPVADSPKGTETWLLLEGLRPASRYELRICWQATQPTSFWLYTHSVDAAFSNPDLLTSISSYSHVRHAMLSPRDLKLIQLWKADPTSSQSTFLFLQVFAAADYFSLNETLMNEVPPLMVDIILDPYILDIFPKSLLWTGLYLVVIAAGAWFLSGWMCRLLSSPPASTEDVRTKKSK